MAHLGNWTEISFCPDDEFGPWAGLYCRGSFDFTLLFEETILSILLSGLFICLAAITITRSISEPYRVKTSLLDWTKLALSICLISLSAAILALRVTGGNLPSSISKTIATVTSAALVLTASVLFATLSIIEQRKSVRPTLLITAYLSLSILLDTARARTLWLLDGITNETRVVFTTSVVLRCLMLAVETLEKRPYLLERYQKASKESLSGPINRSLFWWMNPLFLVGYRKPIGQEDLYELDDELRSERLARIMSRKWETVADEKAPNALLGAWFGAFRVPVLLPAFARIFMAGFTFAQPFLVTAAIELAALPQELPYNNLGYGLIGAFVLVYGGIAVSTGQYEWRSWRSASIMRGSLIPLVHEKALRLDSSTKTGLNHLGALTLITTDIETIVQGLTQVHETWANLVEIGLFIYLLERQLGAACAVSVGFAIAVILGTGFIAVPTGARQAAWNQASQDRVSATSTVLGSVKAIRVSGLTEIVFSSIRRLRRRELQISERFRWLLGVSLVLSLSTPIIGPLLTFATAAGVALRSDSTLTISQIFTAFSIMVLLNSPLTKIVIALPQIAGMITSFQRIQDFINEKEWCDKRTLLNQTQSESAKSEKVPHVDVAVRMQGRFSWSRTTQKVAGDSPEEDSGSTSSSTEVEPVHDLVVSPALEIPRNKVSVVMGPVGCGKSTFLRALLGELSFDGELIMNCGGAAAFSEQDPWMPNETVNEFITGQLGNSDAGNGSEPISGLSYDKDWYRAVVRACQLEKDVDTWPKGDETVLGSKGAAMSGGQKQRLSLARAIYARRELVLLDDSFSGIDASTEDAMFSSLFGSEGLFRSCNMTVVIAPSSTRVLALADMLISLDETGQVSSVTDLTEENAESKQAILSMTSAHIDETLQEKPSAASRSNESPSDTISAELLNVTQTQADAARQVGDSAVYKYYATAAGYSHLIGFAVAILIFAFCDAFPSIWLKWWAEENERTPNSNLGRWFGVYTLLCIGALAACVTGMWQLFIVAINRAGSQFHEILLKTVSRAPMSFHSTTDIGIIVNRFSQDLQLIDMELPPAALGVTMSSSFGLAQFILVCASSRYMSILLPFLIFAFYAIGHFYLRTARQLRHLDIEFKAPLYSHLMQTVSGVVSIRAFKWERRTERKNFGILDDSQQPSYLLYCAQRWLTFAVNMVIMVLAIVLIVVVTTLREAIGPGYIGVALSNLLAFSFTVQAIITSWVQLEVSLGAVSRVKTFATALPSEDENLLARSSSDSGLLQPPQEEWGSTWPSQGRVCIDKLVASYPNAARVLDGVSLDIVAGQKVAICGRTGSGKSSLFLSILGLIDVDSGSIVVDGINLASLPREYCRTQIVAIPQEPYLLDGSVRENVDPHYQHDKTLSEEESKQRDQQIQSTLEKVGLWKTIEARGGLTENMDSNSLSQGQMQLFMLARAMMRQTGSRLLLIDEATSSLDNATTMAINEVIAENFQDWTVLSIVHKLETTLECDKIVVLGKGRVLESGNPRHLLAREHSEFRRLYHMSIRGQM